MSAVILGSVSHEDGERYCHHSEKSSYAASDLGSWMLQRRPEQRGCWYVQMHIRGLCVDGLAVQDDFGSLQMVAV